MPLRFLTSAYGAAKVAIAALAMMTGCVLALVVPSTWLDPNKWDAAGKVVGALVGFSTLLGLMWKGITQLHRRAVMQGRREAIDDLLSIRAATDALVTQFTVHTADDSKQFDQLFSGQHHTHELLEKLDEKMDKTDNEVSRIHGQLDVLLRGHGSDRDRRR